MTFAVRIPFVDYVGLELVSSGAGAAELAITLREELCNSWSVAHGGVTMTLLDVAMAQAARSPNQPGHATSASSTSRSSCSTSMACPTSRRR